MSAFGSGSVANATAAPNGTTTADLRVPANASSTHTIWQTAASSVNGVPYTTVLFVKPYGYTKLALVENELTGYYVSYDATGSGTVLTESNATGTITPLSDGWYRITHVSVAGGTSYRPQIFFLPASYTTGTYTSSWTANGTSGMYLWGASLYRSDLGGMKANTSAYPMYNPTTPKNLLGYTEDWSNAAWTKSGLLAFGSGSVSNAILAPNGLQTADKITEDTSNGNHRAVQPASVVSGTTYVFSVYAKAAGRNFIMIQSNFVNNAYGTVNLLTGATNLIGGTGTLSAVDAGDGWWRVSLIAPSSTTGTGQFYVYTASDATTFSFTGDGTSGIYLWGAQLSDSASLDTYAPNYGAAPTAAAYYGPRLDADPVTLAQRGLLVEESRVNRIRYSRTLETTSSYWGNLASGTANTITIDNAPGPDSLSTSASMITYNTAVPPGVGTDYSIWRHNLTTTANGTYTFSVWLKAGTTSSVALLLNDSAGNRASVQCSLTSSWQRFTVTGTTVASITAIAADIGGNGFLNLPVTAGTVYAYGAQLEFGGFATSYIPNGDAIAGATRNADVASVSTQAFPYSATEGTLVANGSPLASVANTTNVIAELGDGGATNIFEMYRVSGTTNGALYVASGGVGSTITISNAFPANAASKFGGVYKVNDFQAAANGTLGTPVTSGAVPTAASNLYIGKYGGGTTTQWNGHIRQITYLPRRISNAELQTRTA
jgi:hypothetical protein